VQQKLNADPFDTRGEEIRTRYEDDYKFHRYTNRYGNAFGSEFYTIRITCRFQTNTMSVCPSQTFSAQ
jgi:hypothetical protein